MEFFQENIHLREVLVQLIAFVVVFLTLKKLTWKPILDSLQARQDKVKSEFDHIEATKAEIEKLKTDYQEHLQKIEDEAREKMNSAIEEGNRIAKEIQEEARGESQKILEKTKRNVEIEMAKAKETLRQDVAVLAVQVAEKVVGEKMNEAKQDEKILELIEDLEKSL